MKRIFKAAVAALAILMMISIQRTAYASESEEYIISGAGDALSLSVSEECVGSGDINELLSLIPTGSAVVFSDAEISESFDAPRGDYTFSGSLKIRLGTITVREGSELRFSDFELDCTSSSLVGINLRGGRLEVISSSITSGVGGAILSDYSQGGEILISSSTLSSASQCAAVKLSLGSLSVVSSSISNSVGTAIECRASLSLSGEVELRGALCDVLTDRAISLSYGECEYDGGYPMRVSYDGVFSNGQAYEIFNKSSEASISRITLFDRNGKEYSLSYFDRFPSSGDRCVAMVYLPFTVRFFDGSNEISSVSVLYGESITLPNAPRREGYEFQSWKTASGEELDSDAFITKDMNLYPSYRLLAPGFKISSLSVGYTGDEHFLTFGEVSHPLDALGGFAEFVWYRAGEVISRGAGVSVRSVADSGEYSCLITYSYESDTSSVLVEGIGVSILPREIPTPTLQSVEYDGTEKIPTGLDRALYSANVAGFINAGVYEITLTLHDGENCVFSDSGLTTATVSFEITKAENRFVVQPSIKSVYEGMELEASCEALFGEVYFVFSDSQDGEYVKEPPSASGKYYLRAAVDESENYESLLSDAVVFEILRDFCVSLEVVTREDAEYTAFDRFVGEGVVLNAKYKSGLTEQIDMSSVSVKYQRGSYLRYGDSGVILSFGGISITYPLTVSRAEYSLESIELSEYRITYDGKYHEYALADGEIIGRDGIALEIRAVGGGTNAGEYAISVQFSTESSDYNVPSAIECVMIIERAAVELSWKNLCFVYDGTKKKPTCSYVDVFGIERYPEVYGEKTNAGSDYVAYVNIDNRNYDFSGESCTFEIEKASYDLTTAVWQGGEFVYNGIEQSVYLSGLPSGVSVIGYTDACATNAGVYRACVTLAYDSENYHRPQIEPYEWSIRRASYDMGDFDITDNTVTFDGGVHYPKVVGNAPVGVDGSRLRYSFSHGITHATDGAVSVRVEFFTDSANYEVPDAMILGVTVLPKEIEIEWSGAELTYNGCYQLPVAVSPECEIDILGSAVDVGAYTATAVSKSSDFSVKNSSFEFKINKAENGFIGEITVGDVYTERDIQYSASALFGEIKVLVYSDAECGLPAEITEAGEYYLVFTVDGCENYGELRSEPIRVSAVKLAITELEVQMSKSEYVAYETPGEGDFVLTARYNDGTAYECDLLEISIIYQCADSLRRGDTEITLVYSGISLVCQISVDYAELDLSGVTWEGLDIVYDGEEHVPNIIGLPEGLTLLGFEESPAIRVGEYTFTPVLSYDEDNYLAPVINAEKMVINKQIVPSPSDFSVEYDGNAYIPTDGDGRYTLSCAVEIKNAGSYELSVQLSDSENFALSGEDTLILTVTPRVLNISVSEGRLLADGSITELVYEITEGSVVEGDDLMLVPMLEGDGIVLKSENPNYLVVSAPGRIMTASRAMGDFWVTLIAVLISGIVMLVFYLVYKNRFRIFKRVVAAEGASVVKYAEPRKPKAAPKNEPDKPEPPEEKVVEEANETAPELKEEQSSDFGIDIEKSADLMERAEKIGKVEIDMEKADSLITDALAKDLIKRADAPIRTGGSERSVINVDTLSEYFYPGERVDINSLKRRGLVPRSVSYIKVLARGRVDKPLSVYANEFTPAAVKMIVLSGGEAIRAHTVREKDE